ncbi:hypothetical protein [Alicyclobacillus sp. ALC3]|uniref:hypothetical protein n=1 Tax=Alicyclobacillus sp. ALC3 TaxID=2796143 RepID=UPI002377F60B|nr:hypothetical protein [Alicyclobacillus sp. ALC3]WDL98142.1 hypothetical protein JC200_05420 [Alicyclobacillus sp. ALC3]
MRVHVVALQAGNNNHFHIDTERVPHVGELIVERSAVYSVESVMTYRTGNGQGAPVVTVKRAQADQDMERLMNELDAKIR